MTRKQRLVLLAIATACLPACIAGGQDRAEITQPPNGNNQKAEVSQWIGLVKVTIAYHSPHVHSLTGVDRNGHIWGELVQYGFFDEGFGPSTASPWRAGANESTTITVSHDVNVEGKALKAGTYALFLEVEKTGPWTWIFSTNSTGWGSFQYDQKYDALRVSVDPVDAPYTEDLTYGFDGRRPNAAVAYLQWENKRIPFRIDVQNVNELYVAQMRRDLLSWPGFDYRNWQIAAQFCATNKINLEEALVWADKAIDNPFRNAASGQKDFSTMSTKAAVLRALAREADADATMDEALRLPGADAVPVYSYAMRLLTDGRKDRAMKIFTLNARQHPNEKFWTYLGLARGYTATGDRKSAIASWEMALRNVPASQQPAVPSYEKALAALKGAV